ncbi:MAG TPA: hypothetical protein VGY75_01350 [Candidatus Udaeobacter sp.]|jgi:hypothetical protein|nr:hypothetical protein [Candidatus Udaeobacter sp.]
MSLTAEPLKAGPEWLRPRDMRSTYGIGRAHAYNLFREGKIHGVLLRQPGKATGIRLFLVAFRGTTKARSIGPVFIRYLFVTSRHISTGLKGGNPLLS